MATVVGDVSDVGGAPMNGGVKQNAVMEAAEERAPDGVKSAALIMDAQQRSLESILAPHKDGEDLRNARRVTAGGCGALHWR